VLVFVWLGETLGETANATQTVNEMPLLSVTGEREDWVVGETHPAPAPVHPQDLPSMAVKDEADFLPWWEIFIFISAVTQHSKGDEGEGLGIRVSGLRSGGGLRWGSTSCRGEAAGAEAGWGEIPPFL
jgi:hypothetical protein